MAEEIQPAVVTTWRGQRVQVQQVPGDPSNTDATDRGPGGIHPSKDRYSVQPLDSGGPAQWFERDKLPDDLAEALHSAKPVTAS